MRFISVTSFMAKSVRDWKRLLAKGNIVITSREKPIAILTATSDQKLKEDLAVIRKARALMALELIHRNSVEKGLDRMTLEEINAEIRAARKERRK